jgi:D-hexose-6-phosphate mutarotase
MIQDNKYNQRTGLDHGWIGCVIWNPGKVTAVSIASAPSSEERDAFIFINTVRQSE